MPNYPVPGMSKEPATFFEALEIIADQRAMLTNYKNLLRDSTYDLEETRKWAISLDKELTSLTEEKNAISDELEKYKKDFAAYREDSLNSAKKRIVKLDTWAIASYVVDITGNEEMYFKDTEWLKSTLWKFLQLSGGRWPYANEYEGNLERIRGASRETLIRYLGLPQNYQAHIDQLQADAEIVFSNTYYLPEWV